MKSYLGEYHFSKCSGTVLSPITEIEVSVPQGAVIVPMLFNFYVSDQLTIKIQLRNICKHTQTFYHYGITNEKLKLMKVSQFIVALLLDP